MASITVLGSINTDMVVPVERLPSKGETVLGGDLIIAGGGKGANQAVAASRLGARVSFVGAVGDDDLGRESLARLHAEGIDTQHVRTVDSVASGVALILVDPAGDNVIAVSSGVNARLAPDDVSAARDTLSRADIALAQLEVPMETVLEGMKLARELNCRTVLNPAPAPRGGLPDDVWPLVDVVTPNLGEAKALAGREGEPEELASCLLAKGVGAVVITLGEEGALVATPERVERVPGFRVEAVDTTAAGDAFSGALGVALGEGRDLFAAARFAALVAALSVTKQGAQPSLPRREEVERALAGS